MCLCFPSTLLVSWGLLLRATRRSALRTIAATIPAAGASPRLAEHVVIVHNVRAGLLHFPAKAGGRYCFALQLSGRAVLFQDRLGDLVVSGIGVFVHVIEFESCVRHTVKLLEGLSLGQVAGLPVF